MPFGNFSGTTLNLHFPCILLESPPDERVSISSQHSQSYTKDYSSNQRKASKEWHFKPVNYFSKATVDIIFSPHTGLNLLPNKYWSWNELVQGSLPGGKKAVLYSDMIQWYTDLGFWVTQTSDRILPYPILGTFSWVIFLTLVPLVITWKYRSTIPYPEQRSDVFWNWIFFQILKRW